MSGYSTEGELKNVIDHGIVEKFRLRARIDIWKKRNIYCAVNIIRNAAHEAHKLSEAPLFVGRSYLVLPSNLRAACTSRQHGKKLKIYQLLSLALKTLRHW